MKIEDRNNFPNKEDKKFKDLKLRHYKLDDKYKFMKNSCWVSKRQ